MNTAFNSRVNRVPRARSKSVAWFRICFLAVATLCGDEIAAVPSTVCQRATCPVKVDGVLDEEVWRLAKPLSPMRDLEGGKSEFGATIKMVYDDEFLYISATLPENTLRATLTKRDSVIFHDDDFEVFIDPGATGRNYLELEINQLNTVWDLFLTAPYGRPFCEALHDWDIKGLRTAVTLQGTLNDGEGDDTSWTVEIAWPWESITGHSSLPRKGMPPQPGTVMRMNFSRVDHVDGVERNTVWAPTRLKTIHAPEHWGRVRISANPVGTPERPDLTIGLWVHGNDASVTAQTVGAWADAGVTTLIIDGQPDDIARVSKLGKAAGMRTVAWFWTLNRPGDSEALKHPQWYATSAQGKSCHDPKDRPFVSYYQFLCPSNPEALEHLKRKALEIATIPEVDALQMDYIRMPDVVLPKALWPKYGLDMSKILPQFDFCYCARCKARFGREPKALDKDWTEWRLDCVARAANFVADAVRAAGKPCGAAVFPTPRMSADMVRQDWSRFKLDFAFPMDYASFYGEGSDWISSCISEARKAIDGNFPIFPGLYLHDFTPAELETALPRILKANPEGFCLFAHDGLTPERLAVLRRLKVQDK